ncbi:MAG: extracellular solute-binding protein [Clostridia bacterium]|nr:extracellular solute-binding protein [Clostridia bacterium]
MRKSKVIAAILVVVMAVQMLTVASFAKSITELDSSVPFVAIYKAGSYGEYLQAYARAAASEEVIQIDLTKYSSASDDVELKSEYEGRKNVLVTTDNEDGYVEFQVEINATGLYGLGCSYYTVPGKGVAIERSITIDGESPYTEARTAALDRVYVDSLVFPDRVTEPDADGIMDGYFVEDINGNQIRPSSVEKHQWIDNSYFKDSTGSYDGALQFYLEKGVRTIRLSTSREPLALSSLYLYGVQESSSYTEYLAENSKYVISGDQLVAKIQAEYPYAKSSTSVYSGYDRSSAATQPQSSARLKYNVLGGDNWNTSGQWVEYKVNVPQTGLYKIVLRARQNLVSGTFSSRQITVNGETPVAEATRIRFPYDSSWIMSTPVDDYGKELLFKFNEGENIVRITATTGELSDYINAVDTVVSKLNNDYRKIMQITGSDPDEFRDYKLDEEIPDVISDLKAQGDILMSIYNNLIEILGGEGQQTAIVYNVISVLYDMADDPDEIPSYFDNFKNQITNLGSWLSTMRNQPLEIDYILVAEPDYVPGDAESNFFEDLWHNIVMFAASFTTDSNAIGATTDKTFDTTVSIWATTGKERAEIKQRLIERAFINQYNIGVDIKLVPGGALLPSVFAGKGPDIVMGLGSTDIINYASRNALVPLNTFEGFTLDGAQAGYEKVPGFDEVKTWFSDTAFTSITLEMFKDPNNRDLGTQMNTYGLPEKQSFDLLFYREDVMADLGVEIPKTWTEVYDMIAVLKKRYMDFAPPDFLTLLYQRDETLYKNNGYQINLDSETAIQSFIAVTDYYITYNCPKSFNFQNRFRFGEMPVGMQPLSFYNTLCVAAPEIRGSWTFTTVPGTEVYNEDGTPKLDADGNQVINYKTTTSVSSIALLNQGVNKGEEHGKACWAWMTWWAGADAQYEYGIELEASLGIAARYNTANLEAAQRLPWTTKELKSIMDQWENTVGYEEQVGGYYYSRYYSFAFNEVLDDYTDARETLLNYVQEINKEIKYKREQLNLPYSDSYSGASQSDAAN